LTEPLLDAAFLARLERVALRSRRRAEGLRAGGHASRKRGESLEFVDHREYVPGDDLRHLDWQLLARLDRLFVKLFEARQDRTVDVLIDASGSMAGAKATAARKAAAAIAFASLCGLDRVRLFAVGAQARPEGQPHRGRRAIHRILAFLGRQPDQGPTDLASAVRSLPASRGGALTVLITDLWNPDGFEEAFARLGHRGGEAHVLHVLDPRELDPRHLQGDLTLVDAETGAELNVTVDRPTRQAYADAAVDWLEQAAAVARRRGLGYATLAVGDDLEDRLIAWLLQAERSVGGGSARPVRQVRA
jgi:uncharacterized protein (DUF58 family)